VVNPLCPIADQAFFPVLLIIFFFLPLLDRSSYACSMFILLLYMFLLAIVLISMDSCVCVHLFVLCLTACAAEGD
jgi:hypothetical protein